MKPDFQNSDVFQMGEESLFSRLQAGELPFEEQAIVEKRLRDDSEFRKAYLRWSILDTDLRTICREDLLETSTRSQKQRQLSSLIPWLVAAATIFISVLVWVKMLHSDRAAPDTDTTAEKSIIPEESATPVSAAIPHSENGSVAIIVSADGGDTGLSAGQRLVPGTVKLKQGNLLIAFLGGARMLLEGPAELVLQSSSSARLVQGKAAVRDSSSGKPFRLDVPDGALVDLGTEFAVMTDRYGHSFVKVQEGEVSVSVIGGDGTTFSDVVGANSTRSLVPRSQFPLQEEDRDVSFSRVPSVPLTSLNINSAYVNSVRNSQPLIYWRFEDLDEDGMVPDEGSLRCRGKVLNRASPECLQIRDGHLELLGAQRARRIESERSLPGISSEELSLELWVQTAEVSWQMMCGMLIPNAPQEQRSAVVLELSNQLGIVPSPMAFRAVSRMPAERTGGYNLFGKDLWMPGGWHYVVFTRGNGVSRLYIDGKLVDESSVPTTRDNADYHLVLGQLHTIDGVPGHVLIRQFVGAMDEFALYDQVLPAETIAERYRLVRP